METNEIIRKRKDEHIKICLEKKDSVYPGRGTIGDVKLVHRALPELDLDSIDPSSVFLNKKLSFPLIIGSMSGGGELSEKLNRTLGEAAAETGVGLALGSGRIMLENNDYSASFDIRKYCPQSLLIANLGANQLEDAVNKIAGKSSADAVYLHLNSAQELMQVEGDRDFRNIASKIKSITGLTDIPVGVKETGMGFSCDDIELLESSGISFIDSAGNDGTNWALIEGYRWDGRTGRIAEPFKDWGISSLESLKNCLKMKDSCFIVSSGGITNGLDMLKAVILGADAVSVSLPFLGPALHSTAALIDEINLFREVFIRGMLLTGAGCIENLKGNLSLISDPEIVKKFKS